MPIKILPPDISNKIAAGEVVERLRLLLRSWSKMQSTPGARTSVSRFGQAASDSSQFQITVPA